jgi:hypothetical protein
MNQLVSVLYRVHDAFVVTAPNLFFAKAALDAQFNLVYFVHGALVVNLSLIFSLPLLQVLGNFLRN